MTVEDCRKAAALADMLDELADVRKSLGKKEGHMLEIASLDGDRDGGTSHAQAYLPARYADFVLDPIEAAIRKELSDLGVTGAKPAAI